MKRRLIFLFTFILCFPVCGESKVFEGHEVWQIILTPQNRSFVGFHVLKDYANESNSQKIIEATSTRIVIERRINYAPFTSGVLLEDAVMYRDNPDIAQYTVKPDSPYILSIAEKLSQGKKTQLEYVDEVLYYIREHLVWRSTGVIDAVPVLKQGYSVCAGFANAMISLLRAEGIPARVSQVQTIKHWSWNAGGHAEVEVFYDDVGWVSYDPQKHQHHTPFPRVFLGHSLDSYIWSTDEELWNACNFFTRNPYNVQYVNLKSDKRLVDLLKRPVNYDFVSRSDGYGERIPHIRGKVYDGKGNPFRDEFIYYTLEKRSNHYDGAELSDGLYIIKNDKDGGMLFYDNEGYAIYYNFAGSEDERIIEHNIYFDETDSIIFRFREPEIVKWHPDQSGTYYLIGTDDSGVLRLHINRGKYRVDNLWYEYKNGRFSAVK